MKIYSIFSFVFLTALLLGFALGQENSSNCLNLESIEEKLECLVERVEKLETDNKPLQTDFFPKINIKTYTKLQTSPGQSLKDGWSWETTSGGEEADYQLIADLRQPVLISKTPCALILSANGHMASKQEEKERYDNFVFINFFIDGEAVSTNNDLPNEFSGAFHRRSGITNYFHPLSFTQVVEINDTGTSRIDLRIAPRTNPNAEPVKWIIAGAAIQVMALGCN